MVPTRRRVTLAMKTTILLFIALAATTFAAPPRPVPTTRYTRLWTDSPFTTKPPPQESAPEVNPLEDYALGGVSPMTGGYRVTLLNRKNPEERIVLPDNQDYKILSVQYSVGDPLGTTVRVSTGSKTGTVSFDKTLLTLKAAPAAQPPPQPGQQMPPGMPGQVPPPNTGGTDQPRAPRPRVVPPAPAGNAPAANQGGSALPPGVVPQPQQAPSSNQRINRR